MGGGIFLLLTFRRELSSDSVWGGCCHYRLGPPYHRWALVLSGLKSVPGETAGDPAMLRSGALGQQRSSQTNPSVRGCSHRNGGHDGLAVFTPQPGMKRT